MRERRAPRRAVLLFALWASVTGGVLAVSSCYGRTCEPTVENWGENPGEGRLIDEDTWESQAIDAPWLHFPGRRTWIMDTRLLGARLAAVPRVYVSGSPDPVRLGGNFTEASGNLAEIVVGQPGVVIVTNGTCAEYYVRVVVGAAPVPPDPAPQADAGSVAPVDDGGTDDAGDADGGDAG